MTTREEALGRAGPGAGLACRVVGVDGYEVVLVCRGDAVDVYHGRREITTFSVAPRDAVRLAWFLLWRFWVRACWGGWRLRRWEAERERAWAEVVDAAAAQD